MRSDFFVDVSFISQCFIDYAQEDMASLLEKLDRAQIKNIMNDLRIKARTNTKEEMIGNILTATVRQSTLSRKTIKQSVMEKITNVSKATSSLCHYNIIFVLDNGLVH